MTHLSPHLSLAPTCLPGATALEFLDCAGASGCDSIGLRLVRSPSLAFHPVIGEPAIEREVRARLAGGTVLDIFTFYLEPAADFATFERALAFGAAIGARYALAQGNDPDAARLADAFGHFCDLCAKVGLVAMIEFNPARPLANCHQARSLIERAGRTNAGICFDPLHLVRSGGSPADLAAVAKAAPHLVPYAQFSDGITTPVGRRLAGEGELPIAAFVRALPPGTPLSVEVSIAQGAEPRAWCKRVIDSTRAWLAAS